MDPLLEISDPSISTSKTAVDLSIPTSKTAKSFPLQKCETPVELEITRGKMNPGEADATLSLTSEDHKKLDRGGANAGASTWAAYPTVQRCPAIGVVNLVFSLSLPSSLRGPMLRKLAASGYRMGQTNLRCGRNRRWRRFESNIDRNGVSNYC